MSDRGYATHAAWQAQGSGVDSVSGSVVTVDDPTDFDTSGTCDIGGTRYTYTRDPDDATDGVDLTLTPAPTGVGEDDWVTPVIGGQLVQDLVVYVSTDDEGDEAEIIVDYGQRDLWPEGDYDPPVPVVVSDDLTRIEDAPGRVPERDAGMSNLRGYQDSHVAASATDLTFNLTYQPVPGSTIHLYWNGVEQEDDAWSLDGWTITVNDPDGLAVAGDRFYVKYLYTDPTLRPPIAGTVTLVGSQNIQNNSGATSLALPTGTQAGDKIVLAITSGTLAGSMPSSSDPRMTTQNVDTGAHLFTAYGIEDGSGDPVTFSVSDAESNGHIVLATYRTTGTVGTPVLSSGTTPFTPSMPTGSPSAGVMVVAQASGSGDLGAPVTSPQGSWVRDVDGNGNSTRSSAWSAATAPTAISATPPAGTLVAWRAIVVGISDE